MHITGMLVCISLMQCVVQMHVPRDAMCVRCVYACMCVCISLMFDFFPYAIPRDAMCVCDEFIVEMYECKFRYMCSQYINDIMPIFQQFLGMQWVCDEFITVIYVFIFAGWVIGHDIQDLIVLMIIIIVVRRSKMER